MRGKVVSKLFKPLPVPTQAGHGGTEDRIRGLLSVTGMEEGLFWPPAIFGRPHQIRKFFLVGKMKFTQGAREWTAISGTQIFLWPQTSPPPGKVSTGH